MSSLEELFRPGDSTKRLFPFVQQGVCRLVLAEVVRDDVEDNLLLHAQRLPALDTDQLIEDYHHLIKLTNPEFVPYPDEDLVR